MKQSLSARIAWRYLRTKKSHSAVGAISVVSICGIAVATAAIICVLSVFNGFKSVIADRVDTLAPDVMVTPANGKAFANGDSVAEVIRTIPEVEIAIPTILENALAIYEGRETPVSIKGADLKEYEKIT
ncbi:MAG: ABC transporter permease, partial [Muribaculaceae bacterium]|nr:ABC transporter permease [Muribaculaceae bacterium]